MIPPEDIENRFTYHPPTEEQVGVYALIRGECHELADFLNLMCPDSREKSLAMTYLEDAVMWANASIARHGLPAVAEPQRAGGGE